MIRLSGLVPKSPVIGTAVGSRTARVVKKEEVINEAPVSERDHIIDVAEDLMEVEYKLSKLERYVGSSASYKVRQGREQVKKLASDLYSLADKVTT
jgi:hypothetical protein